MTDGFNYGGEIAERDIHYKLWPTEGNMVALIDADLLPYQIGYAVAAHYSLSYTQALYLVEEGHAKSLKDTPQYEDAWEMLCKELNAWITAAGCDAAKLFMTDSAKNFRLDIAFTEDYKGQRNPDKPPYFYELKEDVQRLLGAIMSDGEEADDLISIAVYDAAAELGVEVGSPEHREFGNTVVCSSDKDSGITGGWHYDPRKQVKRFNDKLGELWPKTKVNEVNDYEHWPLVGGEPVNPKVHPGPYDTWLRGAKAGQQKTKRVCVGRKESVSVTDLKGCGLKFFYAQIIMGDDADNYSGLKGKGPSYAYELLDKCNSEKELYYAVLNAYKEYYGPGTHPALNFRGGTMQLTAYQRMLEQGRLAWMQTKKGDLWRASSHCPMGSDTAWNE